MIFSNFGIWNFFDNLIFWDVENIMFWIYMFVILVGQALVFLLYGGCGWELSLIIFQERESSIRLSSNDVLDRCKLQSVISVQLIVRNNKQLRTDTIV